MEFEFNNQLMPQNVLKVDDIYHCAIEGIYSGEGFYYYIVIQTLLGVTTICTCGPVVPFVDMLPDGYECKLQRIKAGRDKLDRIIDKWLNDYNKKIDSAKVIPIEEAVDNFRDLREYMQNYCEDNY